MSEIEWAECTDPRPMMGLLQSCGKTSERKCRLFACACVRRIWSLLPESASGDAVEAAERFADGTAEIEQLASALVGLAFFPRLRSPAGAARMACWHAAFDGLAASRLNPAYGSGPYDWGMASQATGLAREAALRQASREVQRSGRPARTIMRAVRVADDQAQADLLRDLIGNPLQQGTAETSWLTPMVIALAQAAYDDRTLPSGYLDSTRVAVLADSLEDAGANAGLLAHLRGPGLHVRGCHVVELVVGRGCMARSNGRADAAKSGEEEEVIGSAPQEIGGFGTFFQRNPSDNNQGA